jgi:hypothetical protein
MTVLRPRHRRDGIHTLSGSISIGAAPVVQKLGLPPQLTVADYLDRNYHRQLVQ